MRFPIHLKWFLKASKTGGKVTQHSPPMLVCSLSDTFFIAQQVKS